jgi:hypothetical protein
LLKPTAGNAPKTLYKYLDPSGFVALTSLTVRFTKLAELNDPFECRLSLIPTGEFIAPRTQRPELEKLLWEYGISCFAEDASNLLLWAHYGRSHTGFVIGFSTEHPSFQSYGQLVRVNYSPRRPQIDSPNSDAVLHALSIKSEEWSYEQEWRIVTPLDTCQKKDELFLKPIDPASITELTLGVGVDENLVNRAIEWQRNHQHVNLRRARLDSLEYKLYPDEELHNEPLLVVSNKEASELPHPEMHLGGGFRVQILELARDGFVVRDVTAEVERDAKAMTENERKEKRASFEFRMG